MRYWIDAQLSPAIAPWIIDTFNIDAVSIQWLGLRNATDEEIYMAAKEEKAVVISKDRDFIHLLDKYGPPPQIILITCGNSPNSLVRKILHQHLDNAIIQLQTGIPLIKIPDSYSIS